MSVIPSVPRESRRLAAPQQPGVFQGGRLIFPSPVQHNNCQQSPAYRNMALMFVPSRRNSHAIMPLK